MNANRDGVTVVDHPDMDALTAALNQVPGWWCVVLWDNRGQNTNRVWVTGPYAYRSGAERDAHFFQFSGMYAPVSATYVCGRD